MSSTIPLLSTQHQDVLQRLAAVEAELNTSGTADLAPFVTYLDAEVRQHFTLEEQALFPLLARHLSMTQGPLAVMNAEHEEFRALVQALSAALRAGAHNAQRAYAEELIALLRGHIAKEDQVLFPMAQRLLNADELCDVDRCAAALSSAPLT